MTKHTLIINETLSCVGMDAKIVLGVNWPLQASKRKVVTIRMSFKLLV